MKKDKGISLIVLVITIIIIIILAGIVILSLANSNPITKANEMKFKSNVDTYNSELNMALSDIKLKNIFFDSITFNAGIWDGTEGNKTGTTKEYITSITTKDAAKFEIQSGKLVYVGIVQIEKDWAIEMNIETGSVTPPEELGLGVNVIATENTTVNGESATYNNPIIPKGFKAINDGAVWPTDWNNGLVIEDESGNQFVWVPVDGTNVPYAKWCTAGVIYSDTTDDMLPAGITNETDQVTNYGGFYIARYEAGNASNVLVSKKNMTVWGNISYIDSKTKAELMYNTTEVKSGLLTGIQWDTVMKWIQNLEMSVLDSTTWGNHINSIAPANVSGYSSSQVAGFSEYWKTKNIYDLAGNLWEWTNEIYSDERVIRSGGCSGNGITFSVSSRSSYAPGSIDIDLSFRVVLYIL
ncbi:MAG: hypothetical protein PHD15_00035 [Clostridia bacterium]|nr:hypothetical protein [Clostridia bacterium]MDD4386141.1 hypothetical protein [Clostridia bacterium]